MVQNDLKCLAPGEIGPFFAQIFNIGTIAYRGKGGNIVILFSWFLPWESPFRPSFADEGLVFLKKYLKTSFKRNYGIEPIY
jgi:hypothetical protein